MAATDQHYRHQNLLDITFAVSSILLLVFIALMLAVEQGYMTLGEPNNKQWKEEQRRFRDVEVAMAQREALGKLPSKTEFDKLAAAFTAAKKKRDADQGKINDLDREVRAMLPEKERADLKLQDVKAQLDSRTSFYNIAIEQTNNPKAPNVVSLRKEVDDLTQKVVGAKAEADQWDEKVKDKKRQKDELERPLTVAIGNMKRLLDDFDRQMNLAIKKKWTMADWFRSLPVIDGFASPTRIEQITLHDLTIDYNFKGVTRFDRCTTCHKGIDRPTYTRENLTALWYDDPQATKRIEEAHYVITKRKELLAELDEGKNLPDSKELQLKFLSDKNLTPARVGEFCAHPRLDLFVGPNSKHPKEKFGCTSCHAGQPSATAFALAAHTPNDAATTKRWTKEHDWESQHMWDFPMLPSRFVESSCLKCHHQVTDLYGDGAKSEAPKLTQGYDIIREIGCFGCHEIGGTKGGRPIGPDLRLEPNPPLDKLSREERDKLFVDPDNPPGTMRKVGPSLYRVSEKTYEEWAVKWLMAPREFRPDTRMPHYYGVSNNNEKALAGTGQEAFPATEIHGIVHYLFQSSRTYLDTLETARKEEVIKKNKETLARLQPKVEAKQQLTEVEAREYLEAKYLDALLAQPLRLSDAALKIQGDAKAGRDLFTKKGCLACHAHASTNEPDDNWPAAPSEAVFGPNLTQVRQKLVGGPKHDVNKARVWLFNWLKDPTVHSPRTRMPVTHLSDKEAADIAAWLLNQEVPIDPATGKPPEDLQGEKWANLVVPKPKLEDLQKLARVYLDRLLASSEIESLFNGKLPAERVKDLGADERELAQALRPESLKKAKGDLDDAQREQLLHYTGRKAISRYGCYGCHDIPGFDNAKPIGTPLNDWGKKDPGRLAFEDIANYVNDHYKPAQIVDKRVDEDGNPLSVKKGPLYEKYFYDALMHETRDGFLNQKLLEPRSYDYNRIRPWDDRSRMPQFKFARLHKQPKEEPGDFKLRKEWSEAMGQPLGKADQPRPAESAEAFAARKEKAEADAREAVMTFVLGLVGESIPLQYLNAPTKDRLAEVKGRQVIEKFNCAGCHVFRPGAFEFKLSDRALKNLDQTWEAQHGSETFAQDHYFPEHRAWAAPKGPPGGTVTAFGVNALQVAPGKRAALKFTLSEAVRYKTKVRDKDGNVTGEDERELRGGNFFVEVPVADLVWPPPAALRSLESARAWDKKNGTMGGAFARLLGTYLREDHPEKERYAEPGPAVPPVLLWEGERVQPQWLFQFLLDPYKVREMAVLRMPKFNMSKEEAQTLVDYFAAVERRVNPNINLIYPYIKTPQLSDLSSAFWRDKTAAYVAALGKDADRERNLYTAGWEKMRKEWETDLKTADERLTQANKKFEEMNAKKDQPQFKADLDAAQDAVNFWTGEKQRLKDLVEKMTVDRLKEEWSEEGAYALAGYRMVVNVCNKCHEVGPLRPREEKSPGPSLNQAWKRLQPSWARRWVSNPQRFVPYASAMPVYFPDNGKAPVVPWMPKFADPSRMAQFQVEAARDTILNLPAITQHPLASYSLQLQAADTSKTGK
jgi:cytochrome c2